MLACHELRQHIVSEYSENFLEKQQGEEQSTIEFKSSSTAPISDLPRDSERAERLLLRLATLKKLNVSLMEELLFNDAVGSVKIDSIIPSIIVQHTTENHHQPSSISSSTTIADDDANRMVVKSSTTSPRTIAASPRSPSRNSPSCEAAPDNGDVEEFIDNYDDEDDEDDDEDEEEVEEANGDHGGSGGLSLSQVYENQNQNEEDDDDEIYAEVDTAYLENDEGDDDTSVDQAYSVQGNGNGLLTVNKENEKDGANEDEDGCLQIQQD